MISGPRAAEPSLFIQELGVGTVGKSELEGKVREEGKMSEEGKVRDGGLFSQVEGMTSVLASPPEPLLGGRPENHGKARRGPLGLV